ncbi:MAG: hypothetical protein E7314_07115 [Clostridiales bacterium]|nr:hypothetical protein [Clostridiales bacterium]
MINWLEILKNVTIISFTLGIVVTIIICYLESRYYQKANKNNNNDTQIMYAHEKNPITEAETRRLETLFKIMKTLIIIAVVAFALYGIVGLTSMFNAFFTRFPNSIK